MAPGPIYPPALLDGLEEHTVTNWDSEVYRQVFEGTPSLRTNTYGARWNPPGVEALYACVVEEAATAEIDHLVSLQPIPISRTRVTYRLRAQLTDVVDLSDKNDLLAVGECIGLTEADLSADDDASIVLCQMVGGAASWLGRGGLLVPSARHASTNVVIVLNSLGPDDLVEELGSTP